MPLVTSGLRAGLSVVILVARRTFRPGKKFLLLHFLDAFPGSTFERSIENPDEAVRNSIVSLFIGKFVMLIAFSALGPVIEWMLQRLRHVRTQVDSYLAGAYVCEIELLYRQLVLERCLSRFGEDAPETDEAHQHWWAAYSARKNGCHLREDESTFARELIEDGGIPPEIVIYLFAIGAIRMDETGHVLLGRPKIDWIPKILAILGISMGTAYIDLLYIVASVEHATQIQHELLSLLLPMAFVAYLFDLVLTRPLRELNKWGGIIKSVAGFHNLY